jgi:hypothetical protein
VSPVWTSGKTTRAHRAAAGTARVDRGRPAWWVAAALAMSCVASPEQPSTGISLAVTVPARSVDLYISGPAGDPFPPFHVPLTNAGGDSWIANVASIPAGPARRFEASAFDDQGRLVYTGSVTLDVVAGSGMSVTLVLQQYPPPSPTTSWAPVIQAVTVRPGIVSPGGLATLTVVAVDPSGGAPSYLWSADCGTLASPASQIAQWSAPGADAVCSIGITVSGTGGSSSEYVPVYVTTPVP